MRILTGRRAVTTDGAGTTVSRQVNSLKTITSLRGGAADLRTALLESTGIVAAMAACIGSHNFLQAWVIPTLLGRERWEGKMTPEDREAFVHDSVTSFLCSPLLVYLYVVTVIEMGGGGGNNEGWLRGLVSSIGGGSGVGQSSTTLARWEGATLASRLGLIVHCGMTLYDYFFAFPLDSSKVCIVTVSVIKSVSFCLVPVLCSFPSVCQL